MKSIHAEPGGGFFPWRYRRVPGRLLPVLLILLSGGPLGGCAYHLGSLERSLPGKVKTLSIPLFKNRSQEVGVEVYFTNSLIREVERGHLAQVLPSAEALVEGTIQTVNYESTSARSPTNLLGTVLTAEYRILITAHVLVRRTQNQVVLWQGILNGERTYVAPQVTLPGLNTVNPIYNLSARRQNIEIMSRDMMNEAYDRMTENF